MISYYDQVYHLFVGFLIHKGLLRDFEKKLRVKGGIKALVDSQQLRASDYDGEPAQDWQWAEGLVHAGFYFDRESGWNEISDEWDEYLKSSKYEEITII